MNNHDRVSKEEEPTLAIIATMALERPNTFSMELAWYPAVAVASLLVHQSVKPGARSVGSSPDVKEPI